MPAGALELDPPETQYLDMPTEEMPAERMAAEPA
jgi:hypothetical protein